MILPPNLLELFYKKFKDYNVSVPIINQYIVGRLLETGNYERHVRRLTNIFKKRSELFLTELRKISSEFEISENGTGQYILLKFKKNVNQKILIERALEKGVRVHSTMQFWRDKAECPKNSLFLGFSKINLEDIKDCIERLKIAWIEWL